MLTDIKQAIRFYRGRRRLVKHNGWIETRRTSFRRVRYSFKNRVR